MNPSIVGWSHGTFGRREEADVEELIAGKASEALAHSGLEADQVGAVFVGLFNNGFSKQDFPASLVMQSDERFRFKPATRVENACATGSAAIHQALNFVRVNPGKAALVVGAEKMTATPTPEVGDILLSASYRKEEAEVEGGFAGIFARIAQLYFQRYGDRSASLARIAAKNHRNGVANPFAQMRKDLGFDFCNEISDKNPYVTRPLRRTDCSLVSDGAAAVVIAGADLAGDCERAVAFRAAQQVNDYLPMSRRDIVRFEGARLAWSNALGEAGLKLEDLDLVETHDCFTIAELIEYEAMGLTAEGEGHKAIDEGWVAKDGKLPINPSGGLKSKGHPIGATGVSMHALCAMQLMGEADDMQISGAERAGVFNMGGAAVANYVSVLERVK